MELNKHQEAFFALLRAGLWENDAQILGFGEVDFDELRRLAEEQSVVGIVTAGLEHVKDSSVPKVELLNFIGSTLQIEEINKGMNLFICELIGKMRDAGIYALLVKGQGVAQCYAKPMWRSSGDVDLLLNDENYQKAKEFLMPLASHVDEEDKRIKHLGMTIDDWIVELHGTMFTEISGRINNGIEEMQQSIFNGGEVRSWTNDNVQVFLPSAGNDIILVFTHLLNHFYVGGVGIRQICDWCRLLWTFKEEIDHTRLENRLKFMGVMTEWQVFGAFAINYLGMPEDAMPFCDKDLSARLKRRSARLCRIILMSGNMGHNVDKSYRFKYPKLLENSITFFNRFGEFIRLTTIFPINAPRFFVAYVFRRVKATILT